jgi:flagellin
MLTVNTNIAALNAYQNLSKTQDAMTQSMQRLSSGYRINSAADDAAGLAISTGMGSQISGMTQAVRNTQDGTSVVQTASGALTEATSILQRMRDLSVQAANDSNDQSSRDDIRTEVTQLQSELGRIASSTKFNGINLLDGTKSSLSFQVGANSDATNNAITVNLTNLSGIASAVGAAGTAFAVTSPTSVTGSQKFTDGTTDVDVDLTPPTVGGVTQTYKTTQDVADALNKNSGFAANFSASVDKNQNLVVTSKTGGVVTAGTKAQITTAASVDPTTHVVTQASTAATGAGTGITGVGTPTTSGIDLSTAAGAQAAIAALDTQIQAVSTAQANLGAYQNRFSHTINNLNTAIQNTTASQSRIRDTDMAQEMTNFSKSQILVQAGTAMLAQANQSSQGILKLLG